MRSLGLAAAALAAIVTLLGCAGAYVAGDVGAHRSSGDTHGGAPTQPAP